MRLIVIAAYWFRAYHHLFLGNYVNIKIGRLKQKEDISQMWTNNKHQTLFEFCDASLR